MDILESIRQESGVDFLARVSPRPRLSWPVLPPLFPHGIGSEAVVEARGGGGPVETESSLLLVHLMAQVLAEDEGAATGVIFLNLEHRIKPADVSEALEARLKRSPGSDAAFPSPDRRLRACLRRLLVVPVHTAAERRLAWLRLRTLLLQNAHVSLVVVDSLAAFYHLDRLERNVFFDKYVRAQLAGLVSSVRGLGVALVYGLRPFAAAAGGVGGKKSDQTPWNKDLTHRLSLELNCNSEKVSVAVVLETRSSSGLTLTDEFDMLVHDFKSVSMVKKS